MTHEASAVKTDKQIVPMRGLEAPVLYVDGSTNMGCNNQVVSLTLVLRRFALGRFAQYGAP
jgi:hypothetical protein